jgi:hypothetical protein
VSPTAAIRIATPPKAARIIVERRLVATARLISEVIGKMRVTGRSGCTACTADSSAAPTDAGSTAVRATIATLRTPLWARARTPA